MAAAKRPNAGFGLPPHSNPFRTLRDLLPRLDEERIAYAVTEYRSDAVSILAEVPGECGEIDVVEDGEVAGRDESNAPIAGLDEPKTGEGP